MSQQPGFPYGQSQPGQHPGYAAPGAHQYAPYGTPGAPQAQPYGTPGAPQAQPYGTPGAPQAQPYGTPGAPQAQPYGTPGAPQAQPYGTPSAAHPTPYSTPGVPQTTPHGVPPSHQQAPYSTPDVVQHTAYGAQPQMPGYGVPMAGNPYGAQAQAPSVDPMWASFSSVAGADQQIDAVELCKCLSQSGITGSYKPFTQETCKILIALLDRKKTGKMGFSEYKELWVVLGKWKQTFESLDKDRSGSLDDQELKSAIASFGYSLSQTALASIMQRYNTNGKVYFDDFIALTTRVRSLSTFFRARDTTGQGTATLGYDDFMTHSMAC